MLADLWPAFTYDLGPDERATLPDIPGYTGPRLALCGVDGRITHRAETVAGWTVLPGLPSAPRSGVAPSSTTPTPPPRSPSPTSQALAAAEPRPATPPAARRRRPAPPPHLIADVVAAARNGDAGGLDALAHPLREAVGDDVLVLPPDVERDLDTLLLRCRHREGLHADLGPATAARYHPGVRALLVGPSGTGKTLSAGWLATRLGLPLYRVDTASIISKYIGETEKNLARLLAVAEHAEVVLLFDEADALFGKRTEVRHANDRFANAQTNYLLQRIETFAGITLLTSNSRTRFDDAFTRRLDLIIEFSLPGPHERRALWKNHLGDTHALDPRQLNQLAATSDLAGGHIRNVVLAAAVHARHADRPIDWPDILRGLAIEYRKLGRQVPAGLREAP
ncbi:MAG: ATP-binding protein [bacterium]